MGLTTKYSPAELTVRGQIPSRFGPPMDVYTTPITPRENTLRLYQGKTPMWPPFAMGENADIMIDCDPENVARSPRPEGVSSDTPINDGYGVDWVYVDVVGGAMVRPGNPVCPDIGHWEDYVTIPDPDTWDWAGCYERNKEKLTPDRAVKINLPGCLFERLIAILDFSEAAVALIDDELKPSVHRFLRAVTDVHKKYYSLCKKWFNADIVNFNDDWGSQRAEFFSTETAREMLFPYIKEMCDYVHSLGMYWDLHCCGFVEGLVPLFVEAGYDSWGGQPMNDKYKLKKLYGDRMLFTGHINCPPGTPPEEQDAIIKEFFDTIGEDNRVFVEPNRDCPEGFREKIYEASRRNYDRLVAEGRVTE